MTDRQGGLLALSCRAEYLTEVRKVLVDGGYTGKPFADAVAEIITGAEVEVVKRNELHTFNSLQMVNLAFLSLLLKRL